MNTQSEQQGQHKVRWARNTNPICAAQGWKEECYLRTDEGRVAIMVGVVPAGANAGAAMVAVDFRSWDGAREYFHLQYRQGRPEYLAIRPNVVMMPLMMDLIERRGGRLPADLTRMMGLLEVKVMGGNAVELAGLDVVAVGGGAPSGIRLQPMGAR